jgi:hypothetical protein
MGPFHAIQFAINGQFKVVFQMFNDDIAVRNLSSIQLNEWDLPFG